MTDAALFIQLMNGASTNNMKEFSMWEEFTEPLTITLSDTQTMTRDAKGIRREDGFTLIAQKMTVETKLQTFICRGDFEEFRFFASHWDGKEDRPSDTYIVKANLISGDWGANKEKHRKLVLYYSKDISSALMAYPLGRTLNTPVEKVLFDISTNLGFPRLVSSEDI